MSELTLQVGAAVRVLYQMPGSFEAQWHNGVVTQVNQDTNSYDVEIERSGFSTSRIHMSRVVAAGNG